MTGKPGSARQPARAGASQVRSLPHRSDTTIDPDRLNKHYKAHLVRAGLRDQRFHDLRHAAATPLLRDGLPVHEVSAVLGHAQTSTTLTVYSHVLPGGNDRAAAAMDRLLG